MQHIFLIVIGSIVIVLIICMLLSVTGLKKLVAFEESLHSRYLSANDHYMQAVEKALDEDETFIRANRLSLGIIWYERTASCVVVRFCAGLTHIYQPTVNGFDILS